MLKKIQESFLGEAEKRITNPFVGSFVIAWIFWNWDFIYAFFFLDQQYVSLKYIGNGEFFTKVEYLKTHGLYNLSDFVWNPLLSSFIVYLGIEWGTTGVNMFVVYIKNKILGLETITKEESQKLKAKVVQISKEKQEENSRYIEETLGLNKKLDEVNQKIEERAREISKKDLKSKDDIIKQLSQDIDNRDERIRQLKEEVAQLKVFQKSISEKNSNLESVLQNLKYTNKQLKEELEKQPTLASLFDDEQEYVLFKKTKYFLNFEQLIRYLEDDQERFLQNFDVIAKKYFETKGIIRKEEQHDNNGNTFYYYVFTDKGNKFVEYYLDEDDRDIPF